MNNTLQLHGVYSAQLIPTDESGRLDRPALKAIIDFERQAGIDGILALGSTGGFPHFSESERTEVLAAVVELADGLPVIANISHVGPNKAVQLGKAAAGCGCPVVAMMAPMYYKMTQADLLAHFLYVAERVNLPVMLYNFPELSGKRIELSTIADFAGRAAMAGIKQSGAEFAYHQELVALGRQKGFTVLTGADTRLVEAFELGVAGCIGGFVNFVPDLAVKIYRAYGERDLKRAAEAGSCMADIGKLIEQVTFPLNIAGGVEARGFKPGYPKSAVSPQTRDAYLSMVVRLRRLFDERGLRSAQVSDPDEGS